MLCEHYHAQTVSCHSRCLAAEVVVTNTVPLTGKAATLDTVRQLTVAPLLAETIRRVYDHKSVSGMFEMPVLAPGSSPSKPATADKSSGEKPAEKSVEKPTAVAAKSSAVAASSTTNNSKPAATATATAT